jgi:hypothetical protein
LLEQQIPTDQNIQREEDYRLYAKVSIPAAGTEAEEMMTTPESILYAGIHTHLHTSSSSSLSSSKP